MPEMTSDLAAKIRELSAKATAGEWRKFDESKVLSVFAADDEIIHWAGFDSSTEPRETSRKNIELIVLLRNHALTLATALERLERAEAVIRYYARDKFGGENETASAYFRSAL